MKNRTVKITVVIAAVLVIGLFGYFVLLPRILLYNAVKDLMPCMDKMPEYFTDYSVSDIGDTKTIGTDYFCMKIPSGLEIDETGSSKYSYVYTDREHDKYLSIDKEPIDFSERPANLFSPKNMESYSQEASDMNELKEKIESFGYGTPDSMYNTYKCMYSFNRDDYSFWDRKKGECFVLAAAAKGTIPRGAEVFFYEREDIRAVILVFREESEVSFSVSMYNVNDLDTEYAFYLAVNSFDEAAAVMNSIEFADKTIVAIPW